MAISPKVPPAPAKFMMWHGFVATFTVLFCILAASIPSIWRTLEQWRDAIALTDETSEDTPQALILPKGKPSDALSRKISAFDGLISEKNMMKAGKMTPSKGAGEGSGEEGGEESKSAGEVKARSTSVNARKDPLKEGSQTLKSATAKPGEKHRDVIAPSLASHSLLLDGTLLDSSTSTPLMQETGRLATWDMPAREEDIPPVALMQSVVALMLVLGAGGFILLAFFTSLEMMLMTLAWTLVGASGFALDALVLTLYGAFVLAPALVVSLYKAFAPKEVKALGGLWHLMFPLMLVLVALTTASLEDLALFSGHLWVFQKLAFLPGLLGCFMGGVFLWLSLCWLRELGVTDKPMVSFSVTTFHYWFLATCQMLGLIFFHEIGIMAMNFFLIGLLPFLYSAIVRLLTGPFLAPWALWAKALGGFFAMALGLPLILMILSVLFQPWMGRQRHG